MVSGAEQIAAADFGDDVDSSIFEQILEMDDEDDESREFSRGIVFDFLDQAKATFLRMESNLENKDLDALSRDGHFLKGSSATLGFTHIKDACEKIQNYGKKTGADGNGEVSSDDALKFIDTCIQEARDAYDNIRYLMRKFYED